MLNQTRGQRGERSWKLLQSVTHSNVCRCISMAKTGYDDSGIGQILITYRTDS